MNKNEELAAILRQDLKSFSIKVFQEIAGNSTYLDHWYTDVICSELVDVTQGKNPKLIINIPPRYMKSILCSVALPAFLLGHNPKMNIICASYSDGLAEKMALDCRKIMDSVWYREIFPATKLSKDRKGISDFETTKGGGRFSTSVGGTLTGRGGDIAIIDDPISPKDANSDTIREKTNDWYGNTLISRLNDKNNGKIIVIMQRTHEMDFTGHLLEIDSSFRLIKMPSIAVEDESWEVSDHSGNKTIFTRKIGEALHPERESAVKLKEIESSMGSYYFASQYQQNPTSRGGNIIKREWLKFYNRQTLLEDIRTRKIRPFHIGQSWDTASKAEEHNDYSVCITYLTASDNKIYILGVYRDKLEFPALVKKAEELKDKASAKYKDIAFLEDIIVEDINSGTGLAQYMTEKYGNTLKPFKPEHDKATRLKNISHLLESGRCVFPDNKPKWWEAFEKELVSFPNGKHDDQCDSLSQLLAHELNRGPGLDWLKNLV
ncbi:MAG: phage terminase large subunit [Elusimicrobia bacterium]|nr:phage terminase large subunit [Elusimicrobiota bacterium]